MRQPHVLGVDEENNERLNTIVELLRTVGAGHMGCLRGVELQPCRCRPGRCRLTSHTRRLGGLPACLLPCPLVS